MTDIWLRPAREEDEDAISALNTLAFAGPDEARILAALERDGDALLSLIAHDDREILGHIEFFRILVDGEDVVAGLGPMCVHPEHQNSGIGAGLVRLGLTAMQGAGRTLVFVVGHPDYYPKFGFSADLAAPFTAPWSGPAFMACRLSPDAPKSGTLTYPRAFKAT